MTVSDTTRKSDKIVKLWDKGVDSHAEIARRVGCSKEYVRQVLGNRRKTSNPVADLIRIKKELNTPVIIKLLRDGRYTSTYSHGLTRVDYEKRGCRCLPCISFRSNKHLKQYKSRRVQ